MSFGKIADDVEYKPVRARLDDLQEQQAGLTRRLAELDIGESGPQFAEQANAVYRGADVADAVRHHDVESQRRAARSYLEVVNGAIAIAIAAEQEAFKAARARFFERNRQQVLSLTQATAAALIALGQVCEAADEFTQAVRQAGAGECPPDIGPIGVGRIGMPTEANSLYAAWLVGAIVAGTLNRSVVPAHWLAEWHILRDIAKGKATPQGAQAFAKVRRESADAALLPARLRVGRRVVRR